MVTGGFFNSVNDDRLYYADQVNNFFEGLVGAGVFETVDGGLQVKAGAGMQVQVLSGRLVDSKGRWLRNDASLNLTIDASDVTLPRYDAIIAAIDSSMEKRVAEIYVKKGVAANTPIKPAIVRNSYLEEYCLAYVYVDKGITSISQSAISDTRPDNSICGFVTGLIDQLNTTELFIQYQTAFDEWFNAVKDTLGSNTIIRQYTSSYTTTEAEESVIPINISQFNKELDVLDVFVNGMKLIQGVDYTYGNNTQVTLTKPLCTGAVVEFEVFKSAEDSNSGGGTSDYPLLYQSDDGDALSGGTNIFPTKTLSECQHGWELIFTSYINYSYNGTTIPMADRDAQVIQIPKISYKNTPWNGELMSLPLSYLLISDNPIFGSDGNCISCLKSVNVYNDHITGRSYNGKGNSNNMVLRSIREY